MIPYSVPPVVGTEMTYLRKAFEPDGTGTGPSAGNGFAAACRLWLEQQAPGTRALLTPSCTASLELAAILLGIQPGDEVIMPSFTFTSTANAFALRGAEIVFVDVRPDTMNIDETLIPDAVTSRTRVIVPVHYAGVSCEMDAISDLARHHGLHVVEDAAQGVMASYRGRALGSMGDLGCYSFHGSKNYTAGGEGGAILVNRPDLVAGAEVVQEKGTNRSQFFRGESDKYTWLTLGSSYLMSDLQAAYLLAQLEAADTVNRRRRTLWQRYFEALGTVAADGRAVLPTVPAGCLHNGHLFYLKLRDGADRDAFIAHMKRRGILAVFHYVPLHSSPAGRRLGRFHGEDRHTTRDSARLVRLPLYYNMTDRQQCEVIDAALGYFS